MFTGIISGVGRITTVDLINSGAGLPTSADGRRLRIETPAGYLGDVGLGDSIAINGACMTVAAFDEAASVFEIDVSAESLSKTVGLDGPGPVNLEKALRANDRLGGHLVSGHVDGIGTVSHFAAVGESWELRIRAPAELARFIAYKGSIAINGVSLTVNRVVDLAPADGGGCEFSINLIPHTLAHTTLGQIETGIAVNLEIDQIARYVERINSRAA
ncbi:riboflavin synthase [Piscinibacter sakaiensis]|uniref:riboflavin synthase n=1 Tax=Piscinibacter sakaiensis TaxID=1547922 RepID=UPI003AAF69E1